MYIVSPRIARIVYMFLTHRNSYTAIHFLIKKRKRYPKMLLFIISIESKKL